jgi:hypothetical protein
MSNSITKEHAERIATKLGATIETGGNHDLAKIYHNKRLVAQSGIRRGSKKDMPHQYVPGQIHVSRKDCLLLAQCPMTRSEWVEKLKEKGVIEEDDGGNGD